ncbi:formyl peptide receptor 2-like [Engystomops pustulosus]|uniref:formyl peptide receptor 2-like n=1 Tax=Engystomops pustulosus TaxID=76066 RepID=UPI003AFA1F17
MEPLGQGEKSKDRLSEQLRGDARTRLRNRNSAHTQNAGWWLRGHCSEAGATLQNFGFADQSVQFLVAEDIWYKIKMDAADYNWTALNISEDLDYPNMYVDIQYSFIMNAELGFGLSCSEPQCLGLCRPLQVQVCSIETQTSVTSLVFGFPQKHSSINQILTLRSSNGGNETSFEHYLQNLVIPLYSIIFILGIIGNGLVIWIAGFRMKKTISSVWFLNLAIADFLCCASIPMHFAQWADDDMCKSVLSGIFCMLGTILFQLNKITSVLLLTAMSVDRWVSVMWPFWAKIHRTQKRVRITAGIIWVMSLLWNVLMFFLMFLFFQFLDYNKAELVFFLISLVIMFVIPFLIIVTSYVSIFLKLRKSKRPQRSQRPYRMITAVILGFFICWAPYYIWPLIVFLLEHRVYEVEAINSLFAYLNSCINPIIYVFIGQDFRHNFLRSIPFRVERAISEHPDAPCREGEDGDPAPRADI